MAVHGFNYDQVYTSCLWQTVNKHKFYYKLWNVLLSSSFKVPRVVTYIPV